MSDTSTPQAAEAPQAVTEAAPPPAAPVSAPRPGPWIVAEKPEDQPFCDWLAAISEGQNPFKTQDKGILREYGRLTVLRRAQEEVNQNLRQATEAVQRATQQRDQLQARAQQVQGSVAERIETLRDIYVELSGQAQGNRATRRANSSNKAQKTKVRAKSGRRAAS